MPNGSDSVMHDKCIVVMNVLSPGKILALVQSESVSEAVFPIRLDLHFIFLPVPVQGFIAIRDKD